MSTQLTTIEPQPLAIQSEPSIGAMMSQFINAGVTSENVAAFAQLVDLKERMDKRTAEQEFNSAFVRLQQSLPVIVAKTEIKNRGKYERFEDVMDAIGTHLTQNGFAVSFTNSNGDGRVTETCHLMHVGGHSRSNDFTVRVSKNADSDTQADCKAATTAKRNALLNALNIVIRQDFLQNEDDATLVGGPIDWRVAAELKERVRAVGADEKAFLDFAGATTFEDIPEGRLPELYQTLARKEAKKAKEGK